MQAAMFQGPKNIVLKEVKIPIISDNEILVRIKAATTCGTDRKLYLRTDNKYPHYFKPPTIIIEFVLCFINFARTIVAPTAEKLTSSTKENPITSYL